MRRAGEIVAEARRGALEAEAEIGRLRELLAKNDAARAECLARCGEEALAMARSLLPELSPAALRDAARLAGDAFRGRPDPVVAREEERRRREEELRAIEADPAYRDRASLLAECSIERAEAVDLSAPDREYVARASHPRLDSLLASNYDTPAYATGWWRLDYYRDWKAGDEVVERFPGVERFAQVRERLLEARATLAVFDAKIAEIDARIAKIEGLARRAEELAAGIAGLDEEHLGRARERVREHLLSGDEAALSSSLAADPGLAGSFKVARGLAAKAEYLEKIGLELSEEITRLVEMKARFERDAAKWSRPKRAGQCVSEADFSRRYLEPRAKWSRRRERYGRMQAAIVEFRDYDRYRPGVDLLWWDVMTDGRLDGDFIPEVSAWHRGHPGWRDHDYFDQHAAAHAHGGGRSFADAS